MTLVAAKAILRQVRATSMDAIVIRGEDTYYDSTAHGKIGHVDLRDGTTTWTRSVPGVRSLALTDNGARDVAASPVRNKVESVAAADGHIVTERTLTGTPNGIALVDDHIIVTLASKNKVVELPSKNLKEITCITVPPAPREITAQAGRVWVRSPLAHVLQAIEPAQEIDWDRASS